MGDLQVAHDTEWVSKFKRAEVDETSSFKL